VGLSYGRSFLGDLSTRLSRLLRFDGEIKTSFSAEALPVLIMGDGTRPGYGDQSMRRFAVDTGDLALSGGTDAIVFRSTADVIITGVRYHSRSVMANATPVKLQLFGPSAPNPVIALATAGVFMDRAASNFDRPPIQLAAGNEALPANSACIGYGQTWLTAAVPGGPNVYVDLVLEPFCLQSGGMLWINTGIQENRRATLYGMTL